MFPIVLFEWFLRQFDRHSSVSPIELAGDGHWQAIISRGFPRSTSLVSVDRQTHSPYRSTHHNSPHNIRLHPVQTPSGHRIADDARDRTPQNVSPSPFQGSSLMRADIIDGKTMFSDLKHGNLFPGDIKNPSFTLRQILKARHKTNPLFRTLRRLFGFRHDDLAHNLRGGIECDYLTNRVNFN